MRAARAVWTLALALLVAGSAAAQSGTTQSEPTPSDPPLPAPLQRIVDHPSMSGASFGIIATRLPDGERLLEHDADALFAPASITKLFTTAAALDLLQPHYVWQTPVAHDGVRVQDRIDGNLWVLGRGAPDLVEELLWLAAAGLHEDGLRSVGGDIVVDDRYFDDVRYGEGWPGGRQVSEAYHAPISALMANFASVRGVDGWEAVPDPALYAGERIHELLGRAGIEVAGVVRRPTPEELERIPAPEFDGQELGARTVPDPLTPLRTIRSEPLGRLVMDVNKFSNNIMAETLLKSIGAIVYGAPGTATKGRAVVASFLNETLGIPLNSYVQSDGSGLSRLNRFSPRHVHAVLLHAFRDFHIGPELLASLKLGGLDGWNPAAFKYPPLLGEARVKSGHIRGVNTLSGFIHTQSDSIVAFCAMVNEHRAGQWEIDQRMAEIVDWIIRTY